MAKIPLSLNPEPDPEDDAGAGEGVVAPGVAESPLAAPKSPVMGWAAVGFGVLGIFTKGYIFVPLAFVCSLLALFMGQVAWAFIGLLLTVIGLLTSPVLLALLGLAWLGSYLGLQ